MPPDDITPESEARWQAWLAKGRAREVRTRHKARISLALVFGATVVAALVIGLR